MPKFRVEGVVPQERMVSVEIAQCLLPDLANVLQRFRHGVHATALQALGHQLWNSNQVLMSHESNQDRVAQDLGISLLEPRNETDDYLSHSEAMEDELQTV